MPSSDNLPERAHGITATPEHPLYVEGKGWVPAGRLAIGNAIITRAGPPLIVKSVVWQSRPQGYVVYNLTVADTHTYFVGKTNGGAWVHNDCDPERLIPVSRWGRPGLEPGDWVMKGPANWGNYLRSFKWQPGMGNQFAPFSTGETFEVPASNVKWPSGLGIDGWLKGLFGQRRYMP